MSPVQRLPPLDSSLTSLRQTPPACCCEVLTLYFALEYQMAGVGLPGCSAQVKEEAAGRGTRSRAARSLSDFGSIGCKSAAAVDFSPAFWPIAGLWACKSGKNCPRWGSFSLSMPKARQAPRQPDPARYNFISSPNGSYNGIFPCLRHGFSSFLSLSMTSERQMRLRVSCGKITSST